MNQQYGQAGSGLRPAEPADDPFDLDRFVQTQARNYADAISELRAGRKRSHWMWYVFPQIDGLGASPMAERYAIGSLAEARAYLRHPNLGPRLRECAEALLALRGRTASEIFGYPDDLKLRSSMTLFAQADAPGSLYAQLLDKYYDGEPDQKTLELLAAIGE